MNRSHKHAGLRAVALRAVCTICALALSAPVIVAAAPAHALPVTYQQTDSKVAFSGPWVTSAGPAFSGGSCALTNSRGASVTLAFVGTRLDLIGTRGPKFGTISVSLDGGAAITGDLYGPDTQFGQVVYSTGDLAPGLHVVRIEATGAKNAAASDAFVGIDAAVVEGTLVSIPVDETDTRIARRGSWLSFRAPGYHGGGHIFSNVAGNEYAIEFEGTRLDLVSTVGPKYGIASVRIDGGAPVDVDFYSPDTALRKVVWSTGDLPPGVHTVRVTCSGRRSSAATDGYVGLDAAIVTGTLRQATIRYEEIDPRLAWNGQLSASESGNLSGGRYVWAGPSWGAVSVTFVGTRMDWIGVTGPQYGIASVVVDGGAPGYVDLYGPSVQTQRVVYTTGALPYGRHTVTIGWTGRKNAAATGTYISYDAFDIGGDIDFAPTPAQPAFISFNYPWNRYIVIDKSDLRLYYVVDGALVASYTIAAGKPSSPTPNAVWRIDAKYYTDPTSVYGPRKMRMFRQSGSKFVFTAYNIHGTNNDASIGTYASAGCIRMHNYEVIPFFDMVPLGTMVVTRD